MADELLVEISSLVSRLMVDQRWDAQQVKRALAKRVDFPDCPIPIEVKAGLREILEGLDSKISRLRREYHWDPSALKEMLAGHVEGLLEVLDPDE